MYGIFSFATASRRRRLGSGTRGSFARWKAVTFGHERIFVLHGIQGIRGSIADFTAKLTMLHVAVIPSIAQYVVLSADVSGRFQPAFVFMFGVLIFGASSFTLGAMFAGDFA